MYCKSATYKIGLQGLQGLQVLWYIHALQKQGFKKSK